MCLREAMGEEEEGEEEGEAGLASFFSANAAISCG